MDWCYGFDACGLTRVVAARKARTLRESAKRVREKAKATLHPSAGGWLGGEEKRKRHDELLAKASQLEKEALAAEALALSQKSMIELERQERPSREMNP